MNNKRFQLTTVPSQSYINTGCMYFSLEAGVKRFVVDRDWVIANAPQVGGWITDALEYSPNGPVLPSKVTKEAIDARIDRADYVVMPDGRTTICQLTMVNGFTIRGESSCVAIENFDKALGEKFAHQRALDAAWAFEGYLLAEARYVQSSGQE